jgi:hypothetical protein
MVAVAQVAERRAVAAKVAGSKPVGHPTQNEGALRGSLFSWRPADLAPGTGGTAETRCGAGLTCGFGFKLN